MFGPPTDETDKIILISFLLLVDSCITPFIPKTNEDKELLVVEGLITDQPDTNIIKLSKSLPLGTKSISVPVQGCFVTISDDLGNLFYFYEKTAGTYITNPSYFQRIIGRFILCISVQALITIPLIINHTQWR